MGLKGISGNIVLLNTLTVVGGETSIQDVTSIINYPDPVTSTNVLYYFNDYELRFEGCCPSINADALKMEVSVDAGVTWQNTNYVSLVFEVTNNGAGVTVSTSAIPTNCVQLTSNVIGTQGQQGGFFGRSIISGVGSSFGHLIGYGGYTNGNGAATPAVVQHYSNWAYANITGLRFSWVGGQVWSAGTIRLYGIQYN